MLAENLPKPEVYFGSPDWLTAGSLCLLWGPTGICKTWVSMALAISLASGIPLLGFTVPKPRKVLYIDGEMTPWQIKDRLTRLIQGGMYPRNVLEGPLASNLHYIRYVDMTPQPVNLTLSEKISKDAKPHYPGQLNVNKAINATDADVIFLDNLSCLAPTDEDNAAGSWNPMVEWFISLRNSQRTVVAVHHAGKDTHKQRGTSRKEDGMDTIISLTHPRRRTSKEDKADQDDDGRSRQDPESTWWKFEKHRGFTPGSPFEIELVDTPQGLMITTGDQNEIAEALRVQTFRAVQTAIAGGDTERQACDERGVARSSFKYWAAKQG